MRKGFPYIARLQDVTITRRDEYAVIEYKDSSISTMNLKIGPQMHDMTDEEILRIHNDTIRAQTELARSSKYVVVEVPLGSPQVRYFEAGDQWVPRGHVLRCIIHDGADEDYATVEIDDRSFTMEEFGRMLTTYAGWGMRIEFVSDEADLHRRPRIEVREPKDDEES